MKLSIIIPVYKVREYISKCLESILCQVKNNAIYEIVLVDDGTPDDSMVIAYSIVGRYSNVKVVNQENQGLSVARNTGLDNTTGDYVWFVDSDDWLTDKAIESVVKSIKENPEIEVFATILNMYYEESGKTIIEYKPNPNVRTGRDYMFRNNDANCGACQRYIFKRSFLDKHSLRFMPHVYHEDGEFSLRMLYLANRLMIIPQPVYNYRIRTSGSIMSTRKMQMNYDLVKIYYALNTFCENNVSREDYWPYKAKIFDCLRSTILFSRKEIFSDEFQKFYIEHKELIREKSGELLLHPYAIGWRRFVEALHFYFFPLFYTKLKTFIKYNIVRKHERTI